LTYHCFLVLIRQYLLV